MRGVEKGIMCHNNFKGFVLMYEELHFTHTGVQQKQQQQQGGAIMACQEVLHILSQIYRQYSQKGAVCTKGREKFISFKFKSYLVPSHTPIHSVQLAFATFACKECGETKTDWNRDGEVAIIVADN